MLSSSCLRLKPGSGRCNSLLYHPEHHTYAGLHQLLGVCEQLWLFCRETQMNIPNVNAVQQQTQMAESMVSRNAVLAEESIRSAEQTESDLVCNLHRMFAGGCSIYWPIPGCMSALPSVNADNAEFARPTTGSCYLMQDIDTLHEIITAQLLTAHSYLALSIACVICSLLLLLTRGHCAGLLRQLLQKHAASTRQPNWLLTRLSVPAWLPRV